MGPQSSAMLLVSILGIMATGLDLSHAQEIPIDVLPTEMPHHISVEFFNDFWGYYESSASGVILDETHILTVRNIWEVKDLSVVSGITNLLSISIGLGTRHTIKNIYPHPDMLVCSNPYEPPSSESDNPVLNDLLILEVIEPFNFTTETRKPVRLPPANFTLPSNGVVAAWMSGGLFDDALKKITIPLINSTYCESFYGKYRIRESMFCGGFVEADGDFSDVINTFDRGAVLMCNEDENDPESLKVLCGLMEPPFILSTKPLVFTKVFDYLDWITETLNRNKQ